MRRPPPEGVSAAGADAGGASAPKRVFVGRVTGAYGLQGWVRLQSFTRPADNLLH